MLNDRLVTPRGFAPPRIVEMKVTTRLSLAWAAAIRLLGPAVWLAARR